MGSGWAAAGDVRGLRGMSVGVWEGSRESAWGCACSVRGVRVGLREMVRGLRGMSVGVWEGSRESAWGCACSVWGVRVGLRGMAVECA